MSAHSAILGGSNAARLLNCPASYRESMKSPLADVPSVYADEGTMLHEVIAFCVKNRVTAASLRNRWVTLPQWPLNEEQVETLAKGIDALESLKAQYRGRWRIVGIERSLPLPGVPGSFGSVDLVLSNGQVILVIDWKFGAGIRVKALYSDDEYDYINPQLAYYACCARAAHARMFHGKQIVLAVIQPRFDEALTYVEIDPLELDEFLQAFTAAFTEALGHGAYRARGDWCRFAPCKATCELWTGPVLDLAALDPVKAAAQASVSRRPSEYEAFLSRALDAATFFETWAEEVRKQAHVYLEDGGKVPNWKLVPKRATRKWVDPDTVPAVLAAAGALADDIYSPPALKSVAQVEKALKTRGIAVPDDLYNAISSGTTIAPADDVRPAMTHATVAADLRQALQTLAPTA